MFANGHLTRTHPDHATITQKPDPTNWRLVVENNEFGNKNRFTDLTGVDVATAIGYNSNNFTTIILDNLTGIEWHYPDDVARSWLNQLVLPTDTYLAKTGWFLPTIQHFLSAAGCH